VLGAELGALLTGGRAAAGRDGPEPEGAVPEALGDEDSPGVLERPEPPPLATARAAAASAGLDAPRTGAAALFDGGGVATVGPDDDPEPDVTGRTLLDAGRLLLDADCGGLDGTAVGRPLLDPAEDVGVAAGGAGRALPEPALGGAGVGREGTAVGRDDPGRAEAAGADAGGVLVTAGRAAVAAELSGRAPAGRARVISSAPSSFCAGDVTCGDASVLIGTVPPPGICRDVLSDRWLLSELTSSPPCSSSRRGTAL